MDDETRHSAALENALNTGDSSQVKYLGFSALEEREKDLRLRVDLEQAATMGKYAEFVAEQDDSQVYRLLGGFLPLIN